MTPTVLILPGLNSSGPEHWQSWLEARHPDFIRVEQANWANPDLTQWISTLESYVARYQPVVLVAHSLACPTIAHWSQQGEHRILGALLVAPVDLERADIPPEVIGFRDPPMQLLPFPAVVVASQTDPYCSFERATSFAQVWGATLVDVGAAGHLNPDSGHGAWSEGEGLIEAMRLSAEARWESASS